MQRAFAVFLACIFLHSAIAQPYIDLLNMRYMNAFGSGNKHATPFEHAYMGSDIPIQLKHNKLIVISPFYDNWNIDSGSEKNFIPQVSGIALPISFIFPLRKNGWSFTITGILRFNGEGLILKNNFQMGGAVLGKYKPKENLTYNFGVYINNDFFGVFIVPLAGIDWRINERNNLFGVLPGHLTYEHKLSNRFYTGGTFRAITNSYRLENGYYLRIDDNQISGYLDCYFSNHFVVTAEPGYGLMRKLRSGKNHNKNYITNFQWDDGFFIKVSASYRLRL